MRWKATARCALPTENVTLAANQVGDVRPGDYLKISVSDTGCGMAPDVLERAFEPFFTTKPVGKGTGLGLSQIFGFAHESGGEVGIESEVGKGTIVSIYLPRTEVAKTVRLHPALQRSEDAHVAGARILLVEDDPRVRTATVDALEDLDYDPISCGSGAEAIELFRAHPFDLVITDVIMPEMTGPELIRFLKTNESRDFAVLFVTGYVGEGETDDLRGYELLSKPFTVGALASAVAAALARTGYRTAPAPQQPRQQADPRQQRVPPLPRLELDVGAGVPVDLPHDIIRAAGKGQARLGQPHRSTGPSLRSAATPSCRAVAFLGRPRAQAR